MRVQPLTDLKLDLRNIIFVIFEKNYGRQQNMHDKVFLILKQNIFRPFSIFSKIHMITLLLKLA